MRGDGRGMLSSSALQMLIDEGPELEGCNTESVTLSPPGSAGYASGLGHDVRRRTKSLCGTLESGCATGYLFLP